MIACCEMCFVQRLACVAPMALSWDDMIEFASYQLR